VRTFASLDAFILAPLAGKGDEAWRAGPPGRWSVGQIVEHLTNAIELSAQGFAGRADKPPMQRRPRTGPEAVARFVVFNFGWFPGRPQAPSITLPSELPDRARTETRLRDAVQAFGELERRVLPARAHDLLLKHPRFGDLTLPEFMHFHVRHAVHHRKQIEARLRI
jgi:hypothetical protein